MKNAPQFLIHHPDDNVAVVVVEGVRAGETLTGLRMSSGEAVQVKALDDIPIGHKVALADIGEGEGVIKYGQDIGVTVAAIAAGAHAHVHNVKTRRW
ncbi:MAG: flagellar biosynthesis protein FlgA [Alphaproteobacteria bacterium]|nr:flagellar biosynthesis protein FlgA [Alphaproteobacteria bacterium]